MPDQNRDSFRESPTEIAGPARAANGNGSTGNGRQVRITVWVPDSGSTTGATSPSAPDTPDLASEEQKTPPSCKLLMDFKNMPLRELIEHCLRTTDEAARTEFVSRITPTIQKVVYRRLRDYGVRDFGLVQDLTHDTFLKLLNALQRRFEWQGDGQFHSWVQTIAANMVKDWFRARKDTEPMDEDMNIYEDKISSEKQGILRRYDEIERCLKKIGADKKEIVIFLLFYKYGCSAKMIAQMPGIDLSENQVETKLASLVRRIRRDLGNGSSAA